MPAPAKKPALLLWPENVPFFRLFTALATQWRWVAVGGGLAPGIIQRVGLDYAVIPHLAPAYGVTLDMAGWARIRAAEHAAIEVWNR